MSKCYECDKVYKGGKDWRIDKGFFSTYLTCPSCLNETGLKAEYTDLRVDKK